MATPGFELGMMLRRAVGENPTCDGIVLGGHGLFTWGQIQQECYENTISIIDELGQFVVEHVEKSELFGERSGLLLLIIVNSRWIFSRSFVAEFRDRVG